jgi:hypothetical protein
LLKYTKINEIRKDIVREDRHTATKRETETVRWDTIKIWKYTKAQACFVIGIQIGALYQLESTESPKR